MFLGSHLSDYSPPGGRIPPQEVVRGLREIDPRMELIYIGYGKWLLGKVEYDREKFASAVRIYENILDVAGQISPKDIEGPWDEFAERVHSRIRERKVYLQGFQPVGHNLTFTDTVLHSGFVEWFRMEDWIWKYAWREAEAQIEAEADGTLSLQERRKEMADRFDAIHKEVHRRCFRHPVSEGTSVDIEDGQIVRKREGAKA